MTASELIKELEKLPGHYSVWLLTYVSKPYSVVPEDSDSEDLGPDEVWTSIAEVSGLSGISGHGPIIQIVGT